MKLRASHTRRLLAILLALTGALPVWAGCDAACMAGDMTSCEIGPRPSVVSPCCASPSGTCERAVPATPAARRPSTDTPSAPGMIVASVGAHHGFEASPPSSPPPPPRAPSPPLFLLHSVLLS